MFEYILSMAPSTAFSFRGDGNRVRLSEDIRLYIMYQSTREVQFVHTWQIPWLGSVHSTIAKSRRRSFCLAGDFMAWLVDLWVGQVLTEGDA